MTSPDPTSAAEKRGPDSLAAASDAAPPTGHVAQARSRQRILELSSLVGIVAAVVLAALVNVLSARHYHRWDWTVGGLYTLSPGTVRTLQSLDAEVQIHVLLSAADPLYLTVRHLLDAYRGQSSELAIEYVDPDREPARLLAIQQRYGIVAGKTDDGHVLTDAAIVVARGGRHHLVTANELVVVDDPQGLHGRPHVEQALTGALRNVSSGSRTRLCFTSGHGEQSLDDGGPQGLGPLGDRLTRGNQDVVAVAPHTTTATLGDCAVVVVAGPRQPLSQTEAAELAQYVAGGGNALLAVSPVLDAVSKRFRDIGLAPLLALANVEQNADLVFELEPKRRSSQGFGESFLAAAAPHAVTRAMTTDPGSEFGVYVELTSSLATRSEGAAIAQPLLQTSAESFGMVDFFTWANRPTTPQPGEDDRRGPLVVAYATELPKAQSQAARGPRLVVIGTASVLAGANWRVEQLQPTALFVESALSWLSANPTLLDIPERPQRLFALRMTERSLGSVLRYTLLYMPGAAVLLGIAVAVRRRGGARRPTESDGQPTRSRARRRSTSSGRSTDDDTPPPEDTP